MEIDGHECYLGDDGTLDTVIVVDGHEFRFSQEYASHCRDQDTGAMTDDGFVELARECIEDLWQYEGQE